MEPDLALVYVQAAAHLHPAPAAHATFQPSLPGSRMTRRQPAWVGPEVAGAAAMAGCTVGTVCAAHEAARSCLGGTPRQHLSWASRAAARAALCLCSCATLRRRDRRHPALLAARATTVRHPAGRHSCLHALHRAFPAARSHARSWRTGSRDAASATGCTTHACCTHGSFLPRMQHSGAAAMVPGGAAIAEGG